MCSAFIFGFNFSATAGTITIETETIVKMAGDLLTVEVAPVNKGNEAAYNVQVHLLLLDMQVDGQIMQRLEPGMSDIVLFETNIANIDKGRYPLTVCIDFHDAAQYPFSAISGMAFYYIKDVNPNLAVSCGDIIINKKGELKFIVKNLGSGPRKISANLILPKELSTPEPEINFHLDAKSERTAVFKITNFSALNGAGYPVFCYFEYDLNHTHYTSVAKAAVKIEKRENLFRRTKVFWIILTSVLIVLLIVLTLKNRGKITPA